MIYEMGIIADDAERALHGREDDAIRNRRWLSRLAVGDVLRIAEPATVMWSPSDVSSRLRRHAALIKGATFTVRIVRLDNNRAVVATRDS